MKKLILIAVLLWALPCGAQQWFCPSEQGTVLTYATYNQQGEITGYSVVRVCSVRKTGSTDYTVTESSLLENASHSAVGQPLMSDTYIKGDTTYVGINRQVKMFGALATTSGTVIMLPPDVTPAVRFENRTLTCQVRFMGLKINTTTAVNNFRLMNIETITVGGRAYDCDKIAYNTATRAAGKTYSTQVVEWYAKGVGPVLSVVTNQGNGQSTTTKLISVEVPKA